MRSGERAPPLRGEIVQGARDDAADGALVYRWPRSFLRLTVEIDPDREEGPIAIEYASDRGAVLLDGPHPVLGAGFRRRSTS